MGITEHIVRAKRKRSRELLTPLFLFSILGILLYAPALFTGFAGDDYLQLVSQPYFHTLTAVIGVFGKVIGSPHGADTLTGFFYRPLPFAVYALFYTVFQGSAFPLHLLQVSLYITSSYLLFHFYSFFFPKKLALLLGIIFLIHPANNDLGAYIAALPDTLALFFGLVALLTIGKSKQPTLRHTFIVAGALTCSLFAKEIGAIFVLLAMLFALFQRRFRRFAWACFMPLILYILLRAQASQAPLFTHLPPPVLDYTLGERIALAIQIAAAFLRELILPTRDALHEGFFQPTLMKTIVPAGTLILSSGFFLIVWKLLKRSQPQKASSFPFFLLWIPLGIVPFIHIVPLEILFAYRWLYLTEIGLLGIAGLSSLMLPRVKSNWHQFCRILLIMFLCLFAIETIVLNFMWYDWEKYFIDN